MPEEIMTLEQRAQLALHMVVPIRCGGLTYVKSQEGQLTPMYKLGGCLVPVEIVWQGWPAINEYRRTHDPIGWKVKVEL